MLSRRVTACYRVSGKDDIYPYEDLGRIITLGLTSEQREDHEDRLVQLYHATIKNQGVTEYDLDRC